MADEYDEEYYGGGEQREDNGRTSIMDDLLRWMPDWSFRIDAFPSGCLTMVGSPLPLPDIRGGGACLGCRTSVQEHDALDVLTPLAPDTERRFVAGGRDDFLARRIHERGAPTLRQDPVLGLPPPHSAATTRTHPAASSCARH